MKNMWNMRNECDQLAIFPFLCVLYSFTSLVMVAILILMSQISSFLSSTHEPETKDTIVTLGRVVMEDFILQNQASDAHKICVWWGWSFDIRNKSEKQSYMKVLVVFVGQAVVRSDILSFLSTINICPVINVILTPQSRLQGDGVKSAGHWTWVEQWTNYPCRCQRLVSTLSIR